VLLFEYKQYIMYRVINQRKTSGSLFHYAHFICDCLFPEIINEFYSHKAIVRIKNISQTIGNFSIIYEEVMKIKNYEILEEDFYCLETKILEYKNKEEYIDKKYFDKFREYIFSIYKINHYDKTYPEVILIKRGGRINLIDDEYLKKINTNITTGKERREINNIDKLDKYLQKLYEEKYKSIYLENMPFEEQIKYFNNANLIICAHGACMANMFFCKEKTKIIEITCGIKWDFFDNISKILNLNHLKCVKNSFNEIINLVII